MLQLIKEFFGFGSDPIKMDLNTLEGEEVKPLVYTCTYEEPVPIVLDDIKSKEEDIS